MGRLLQIKKVAISRSTRWTKLARECHFNEQLMAQRCMVSVRQLQRYFAEEMGRTPKAWINEQRMIAARKLLLEGWPVKAVAADLSYKQASHFCREFKRCYNLTPKDYIALHREKHRGLLPQSAEA